MKAALTAITGVLVTALIAGCSPSGGDDEATDDERPTQQAVDTEPTEPPVRTEAVLPEFAVPEGVSEVGPEGVPFTLDFEHVGVTYQFDGGTELERFFVTSYLLPDDVPTETFDDRKAVVALYDELTGNESESSGTRALTSGYNAVFRYSTVTYGDDQKAFQRNFFVFDGNSVAQITCQWKDTSFEETVATACQEIQEAFDFPAA